MKKREYLAKIDMVNKKGKFKAEWNSLFLYEEPRWFQKAKFGLFIHWGLYSVPAFKNEWYSRNMYRQGTEEFEHHIKTYGPHGQFGYKEFIPMFQAEKFHPEEWAELFQESGAKYICSVAEHHDGFQMYNSEYSNYNAVKMGPKRDLLADIKTAVENKGLVFCTSSHRAEHWFFMGYGKQFESDIKEPLKEGDFYWPSVEEQPDETSLYSEPYPTQEFLEDWLVRTCEIIDRYRPRMLYFDWWIQHQAFKPYLKKFAAYYYNRGLEWGEEVAISYKHDAMAFGTGIVEIERGKFEQAKPYHWQTDTAIARNSWCYTTTLEYKSSYELICYLIDVVSKNGNVLLNIGPKADGTIPEKEQTILREIGAWLTVNGEGIYNSKVYRVSAEGPTEEREGQFLDQVETVYTKEDIRFTVANGCIYAFVLKYPVDGIVKIRSLADSTEQNQPLFHGIIHNVDVLGFTEKPKWSVDQVALIIKTERVKSHLPVCFKISTE